MDELTPQAQALRRVPFFEDLTDEDLERMVRIGEVRRFEPGENLVAKGEVGGGLFVIVSGTATVQTGGKEHALEPGAFIGEMALLERRPRSATVTADVRATCPPDADLSFEEIGTVTLRGLSDPVNLHLATASVLDLPQTDPAPAG